MPGQKLVRQPPHLRETRKIGERHIDPVRARALGDPPGAPPRSAHGRGRSSRPASRRAQDPAPCAARSWNSPPSRLRPIAPYLPAEEITLKALIQGFNVRHPPASPSCPRRRAPRACPWLGRGRRAQAPVALGPRFRGGDEKRQPESAFIWFDTTSSMASNSRPCRVIAHVVLRVAI